MSKICTKCGNVLSDDAKFCARCGKSLASAMNNQRNSQPNQQRQNVQNQNSRWTGQNVQNQSSQWTGQNMQNQGSQWTGQNMQNQSSQWTGQNMQNRSPQWTGQNMQAQNSQWNNQGQNRNQQWNNQGAGLQSFKVVLSNMKNKVMRQGRILMSGDKKKKVLIGGGIGILILLLIVFFVRGSKPSVSRLEKGIPMDYLSYEFDGETRTSKVRSLKVERRMTEKNFDTAYCKVVMEDDLMRRVLYLELSSQKYTQGGWNVTYCRLYQSDEITLKGSPDDYIDEVKKDVESGLGDYGNGISDIEGSKKDNGNFVYTIKLDNDYLGGSVEYEYEIENRSEYYADSLDEVDLPMNYVWEAVRADTSNLIDKTRN